MNQAQGTERAFDRIASNSVVLLVSRLIQKALSFVLLWFLVRHLSTEDFGIYSFVMVWVMTASTFTDMGTSGGATRLWAENPARMARTLPSVFALRIALVIIGVAASAVVWRFFYPHIGASIFAFIAAGILLQFHSVAWTPFQAELNNLKPLLWTSVNRTATVAAIVVVLLTMPSLHLVLAAEIFIPVFLIVTLVKECMAIARKRKTEEPAFGADRFTSDILPLGIWSILTVLYFRIDIFMLMKLMSERAVGQYSAGFRLIEPLLTLPGVLGASLMPIVVGRWNSADRDGALRSVERSLRLMPFAMTLIALPLSFLSEPILLLLFGEPYRASAPVMAIIAWTLPLAGWAYSCGSVILAERKYLFNNLVAGVALCVNVAGNLWLIPRHGIMGAATMTIVTELTWAALTSLPLLRHSPRGFWIACCHVLAVATGCAVSMQGFLFASLAPRLAFVLLGLVAAVIVAISTGLMTRDDREGITAWLMRRRRS